MFLFFFLCSSLSLCVFYLLSYTVLRDILCRTDMQRISRIIVSFSSRGVERCCDEVRLPDLVRFLSSPYSLASFLSLTLHIPIRLLLIVLFVLFLPENLFGSALRKLVPYLENFGFPNFTISRICLSYDFFTISTAFGEADFLKKFVWATPYDGVGFFFLWLFTR